ncbi:hypothetical protein N7532_006254, partial [Penicillium argentinense]
HSAASQSNAANNTQPSAAVWNRVPGNLSPIRLAKGEYVVEWTAAKKVATVVMLAYTTFNVTLRVVYTRLRCRLFRRSFHVSTEVGTLGVCRFIFLGLLPNPLGPFSELRGSRLPILTAMTGFTIFQFAVATSKDLQTLMGCRFFGACPIAVVAAVFSDIFENRTPGLAITLFTMVVFTGPLIASTIGGFIVQSFLGWHWTKYLWNNGVVSPGVEYVVSARDISPPPPRRTHRQSSGTPLPNEELGSHFSELSLKNFSRPVRILFTELIVLSLSVYMAFLYGLLYPFLIAYQIVFQQIHGFEKGVSGLPCLGTVVGEFLGPSSSSCSHGIIGNWTRSPRSRILNGGYCLLFWEFCILWGSVLVWVGWVYGASSLDCAYAFGVIDWVWPVALNYIILLMLIFFFRTFTRWESIIIVQSAASALVANSSLRSLAGAASPLLATYMFVSMDVNWASTLGCIAALLIPLPIIFYLYVPRIRAKSTFATGYMMTMQAHTLDERIE